MRIRTFCKFIEVENLQPHTLRDTTVVIDAQNYFYKIYQSNGLQYVFGCESDRYADCLRKHLRMYQKANVKCCFIFKGGHEDIQKRLSKYKNDGAQGRNFDINNVNVNDQIVRPIFMKNVYEEVLDEMGFSYTVCEYESKRECIAFAQKHGCPVLSFDIEYCFAGVPYIPYNTLQFDDTNNVIKCGIFSLDRFLQKYKLTEDKLATFATLTDENNFPENHFINIIKILRICLGHYKRNMGILRWLAGTDDKRALDQIFRYISRDDKDKFLEVKQNVRELIRRREVPGVPSEYLENGTIEISEQDPLWFQKGVASKRIAIPLVNVTRSHIVMGSWAIADYNDEDPLLFSMDIIKYAYNLLTNFENQEVKFYTNDKIIPMSVRDSVGKPEYEAVSSPFENGWERLPPGLLEHFVCHHLRGLRGVAWGRLRVAGGGGAALLMLALLYLARKKAADTRSEAYSVLLTSLLLSGDTNNNTPQAANIRQDKDMLDEDKLSEDDIAKARFAMREYLAEVSEEEARQTFDLSLLHSLVQFQHCLQWLGYLNELCGRPLPAVSYSRAYSAGAVWRVAGALRAEGGRRGEEGRRGALRGWLAGAPALFAALLRRIDLYEELLAEVMSNQ